jgi:predicted RNA-binding Zn-ribbon protein involved in translation (DUF1610 family)
MRHFLRSLVVLALCLGVAHADVLVLKDGRKLSGRVTEKKDGFEIQIEGETLAFNKEDITRHIKSPKEIVGDADKLLAEAKAIYLEAVEIKDDKAADAKFREALPKVTKAREAYAEARDLFPEGNSELDTQLVQIMKLMRLVRERIGSQLAGNPTPVVKPKEEPPPIVIKDPPPPEPKEPPPPTFGLVDAFGILASAAGRADEAKRGQARALLKKASDEKGPLGDLALAGHVLLSRTDDKWGLKADTLAALQAFFGAVDFSKFDTVPDKTVADSLKALGVKVREVRAKSTTDPAGESLGLIVSAAASALITKCGGKPPADLDAAFKELQIEKAEVGSLWGRKDGLAMDDYRKWVQSGEYGLGVVQFQSEYKSLPDFNVRYALGILMIFKALADNRNYTRAASYLEQASQGASTATARDHVAALAKSIRSEAPCPACGGTHKVNCQTCKGKKKVDLLCNKCGGSGSINTFKGVARCPGVCGGKGRLNDQPCPRCKQAGEVECKAKGCSKSVGRPSLDDFADAFKCGLCRGTGCLTRNIAHACPECGGLGLFLQPKADPTKLLR